MKHFLRDDDVNARQQRYLVDLAKFLKVHRYDARPLLHATSSASATPAAPHSVAVIMEKESTRTRISFNIGITELGGNPVMVDAQSSQLARGESIEDTARVLSGYVDGIVIRTFGDDRINALAAASRVPVINALTDGFHPCQLLADIMTVDEEFGGTSGITIGYVGDAGNNMAHSYLLAGAVAGAHVRVAGPAKYQPDPTIVARAEVIAAETGGSVTVLDDPVGAVKGADVVATDTWVSMGHLDRQFRLDDLASFQVNGDLMGHAADHAIVLHCLPAHRGEEITDEVIDSPQSRVLSQAENRLHVQKALMTWLLTDHAWEVPGWDARPAFVESENNQ